MGAPRLGLGAALLAAALSGGCAEVGDTAGNQGDCNARIGFDGRVFRMHNELDQQAPAGRRLGRGRVLDCDGGTVARARVVAVRNVDPRVAVRAESAEGYDGVYVVEGLPRAEWPEGLAP